MRGVPVVLYRPDGTKGGWVLGFLLLLVLVGGALAGRRFWVGRAVEVLREGMERVRGRGVRERAGLGKEGVGRYVDGV